MTTVAHAQPPALTAPAPRHLIVTLFAMYARPENNWLSVASVVRLMEDLGVDGPSVRSSISRLKRKNILTSVRHDGQAGYSLSQPVLDTINDGDARIFSRRRAALDDGWVIAVFSIPESERDKRHALRTALTRLGFGIAAPGVWIAPAVIIGEVRKMLHRNGMDRYVDLFEGCRLDADAPSKVAKWWNLDELAAQYRSFLDHYHPVLEEMTESIDARTAFADYVPMLTTWRRLPYLDPGLPLELLPAQWPGVDAGQVFGDLDSALQTRAREHVQNVVHPG
ncbi:MULTISPECIES: PaaX family transcriptional regulator C-terminal domain-containing protein [unclassified Gordonia (in: high G+C Gram-positive bacteria)]|uniref:PaaX family transcriptional regulator n=1 Tax=unclassified Gordonia (in: high G+C Gram-positive bacteria) TaxID=2657482 RepID=UPI0009AE216B|nr:MULTISPECIES: PaaX family transcriptional regulator C-terminal domain-containing protein [unclassified Gordonia (in: high G+C Gram-positive bacteria)]MDF3280775.1 PaaX family transcriptional regulator C-terminal domain-containing protein [Gordonia sp. N1V]OPX11881.1 PaaX family transcriptional regulator [Gordonia sp. i37]